MLHCTRRKGNKTVTYQKIKKKIEQFLKSTISSVNEVSLVLVCYSTGLPKKYTMDSRRWCRKTR